MTYRACTIKGQRRTKGQVNQLDDQIIDLLRIDHPQSVRHVFYRMTDPRLPEPVEKSDRGYRHVQDRIVKLRRTGRLPYGWITDASRRGYFTSTYVDAADFLHTMKGFYRADLWRQTKTYVEVWTESRSIAGIVQGDCEELAVSLYPLAASAASRSLMKRPKASTPRSDGRDIGIIYIGDYDPSGVLIDVSFERELLKHLEPGPEAGSTSSASPSRPSRSCPMICRRNPARPPTAVPCISPRRSKPRPCLRPSCASCCGTGSRPQLPAGALAVAKAAEQSEKQHLDRVARLLEGQP